MFRYVVICYVTIAVRYISLRYVVACYVTITERYTSLRYVVALSYSYDV